MDQYLLEYMEKVREYYKEKKTYGKNLKADEVIRRILGRPGLEIEAFDDVPIQGNLELDKLIQNRDEMNRSWSVPADRPITSHRKGIGKLIVFGKRVVRKLLRWYINPVAEDQTRFNGQVTSGFNEMTNKMLIMERNMKVIDRKIKDMEKQLDELESLCNLNDEFHRQQADLAYITYKLSQLESQYKGKQKEQPAAGNSRSEKPESASISYSEHTEPDYFLFENRFRGSEDKIRESLQQYIPWFEGRRNILDIGCGRGEFLELMKENNISARGIDVNERLVQYCRQKGLEVDLKDGIAELEGIEDNSLGGIFMGQVVEHLDPEYLTRLLELAAQKLEPGAFLVAETPNPTMLSTFSNSFYLDLSHKKPIHPETMRFLMEYYGFEGVEVRHNEISKIPYSLSLLEANEAQISNLKSFNDGINLLNQLLFGYQDYVIAGKKTARGGQNENCTGKAGL